MISLDKWKLAGRFQSPTTKSGEMDLESKMLRPVDATCQVCGKSIKAWVHLGYDGLRAKRSESAGVIPDPTVEQIDTENRAKDLEALVAAATCNRCYDLRMRYQEAREDLEKVCSGLSVKWDRATSGYKLEEWLQEKWRDRLATSVKRYVATHADMVGSRELRFHEDMYRAIWFRPRAWCKIVYRLDSQLYTREPARIEYNWFIRFVNAVSGRDPVSTNK